MIVTNAQRGLFLNLLFINKNHDSLSAESELHDSIRGRFYNPDFIYFLLLLLLIMFAARAHLQHGALLKAEAVLEQTGDVGHVHAEESADGGGLGHFIADCRQKRSHVSNHSSVFCSEAEGKILDPNVRNVDRVSSIGSCISVSVTIMHCFFSPSLARFLKCLTSSIPPWTPSAAQERFK